jgi:hypothetical protein
MVRGDVSVRRTVATSAIRTHRSEDTTSAAGIERARSASSCRIARSVRAAPKPRIELKNAATRAFMGGAFMTAVFRQDTFFDHVRGIGEERRSTVLPTVAAKVGEKAGP